MLAFPCRKIVSAVGSSPVADRTTVSGLVVPNATATALAPIEFAQPWPGAPEFPHGHAAPVPSPKQYGTPGDSHSSGTPLPFWSRLVPAPMSQGSGTPFALQSGAPAAISHASPSKSKSQSSWPGFGTVVQLSRQSAAPSPSPSRSGKPQPHCPGAVLKG